MQINLSSSEPEEDSDEFASSDGDGAADLDLLGLADMPAPGAGSTGAAEQEIERLQSDLRREKSLSKLARDEVLALRNKQSALRSELQDALHGGGGGGGANGTEAELRRQLGSREAAVADLEDMLRQEVQHGLLAQREIFQLRRQLEQATEPAAAAAAAAAVAAGRVAARRKAAGGGKARRKVTKAAKAAKAATSGAGGTGGAAKVVKAAGGRAAKTGGVAGMASRSSTAGSTVSDELSRTRVALAQSQQQLVGAKQARKVAARQVAAVEANRNSEREMLVRAAAELTSLRDEATEARAENDRLARMLAKRNLEVATIRDHLTVEAKDREVAEVHWHQKHNTAIDRLQHLREATVAKVHRRAAIALCGSFTCVTAAAAFTAWADRCVSASGQLSKSDRHCEARRGRTVRRCLAVWVAWAKTCLVDGKRGEIDEIRALIEAEDTQSRATVAAEAVRQQPLPRMLLPPLPVTGALPVRVGSDPPEAIPPGPESGGVEKVVERVERIERIESGERAGIPESPIDAARGGSVAGASGTSTDAAQKELAAERRDKEEAGARGREVVEAEKMERERREREEKEKAKANETRKEIEKEKETPVMPKGFAAAATQQAVEDFKNLAGKPVRGERAKRAAPKERPAAACCTSPSKKR